MSIDLVGVWHLRLLPFFQADQATQKPNFFQNLISARSLSLGGEGCNQGIKLLGGHVLEQRAE